MDQAPFFLLPIQLSQGRSANHFLRGAGIPDLWINFWHTTMTRLIQYHSLFISYSRQEVLLDRRLHADLQAEGCAAGLRRKT